MSFDGILLGSQVMVAKEAKTSSAAKQVIVEAVGVENSRLRWRGNLSCLRDGGDDS